MKVTKQDLVNILATTTAESVEVQTYSVAKMNKTRAMVDDYGNEVTETVFDKKTNTEKVKVVKERNPLEFDRVNKLVTAEYSFGGNYQDRVNEALNESGKEANFESKELQWGKFVKDTNGRIIEHTKDGEYKLYVRCYPTDNGIISTEYYVNGKSATDKQISIIKGFAPAKTTDCSTQSKAGLEAEKQVKVANIDFNSIITIKVDDVVYELNDLVL